MHGAGMKIERCAAVVSGQPEADPSCAWSVDEGARWLMTRKNLFEPKVLEILEYDKVNPLLSNLP